MASPWFHYCTMTPGPQVWGPWEQATQGLVFAVGRCVIPDKELYTVGRRAQQEGLGLLEQYFEQKFHREMGDLNIDIADDSIELLKKLPAIHLFVQWEVAVAMGESFWDWKDRITVLWPSFYRKSDFNGRDVVRKAMGYGFASSDHPNPPAVLTWSRSLARAMLMTEKLIGRPTCAPPQNVTGWVDQTVQWWTGGWPGWYVCEVPGRVICLARRYV